MKAKEWLSKLTENEIFTIGTWLRKKLTKEIYDRMSYDEKVSTLHLFLGHVLK